jgi:type IV secretion system protein VirB4
VLDEVQNLVKNAYWRNKIESFLMQIRRKNGIVIPITPDPKFFYSETDAILKQTVTKVYFPIQNGGTAKELENTHGLTSKECEFLEETAPEERKFLLRRGQESVRVVFDLGFMSEFIPVLSSNDKGVALMEEVIAELGTDEPETWVPVFMQRAAERNTHNIKERKAA